MYRKPNEALMFQKLQEVQNLLLDAGKIMVKAITGNMKEKNILKFKVLIIIVYGLI
jgi:hypothetical protein